MRRILFGIIAMAMIGCSGPVSPVASCAVDGGGGGLDKPLDSASYVMVLVNGEPLPVKSPWGAGEWDYDSDVGTWQVIAATLTLKANCTFTNGNTHRAASGSTVSATSSGTYTRSSSTSLQFLEAGYAYSAQIIGNRLIQRVADDMIFTFELHRKYAGA
ncbi:MAG: hypothetical protein M3Q50_07920 [Chloroflexota bacterium]|nr:hypothetical protein [Chloroflexota bacterium]